VEKKQEFEKSQDFIKKSFLDIFKLSFKQHIFNLEMVERTIAIKFCEFKISNSSKNMMPSETLFISKQGLLFKCLAPLKTNMLLRIKIELPDYWNRKSKHVGYCYTEAPKYFQILCRILDVEELFEPDPGYYILCENINLDQVDANILTDYLRCSN